MIFGTYTIKDLEQGNIGVGKDCHLCGEMFTVGMYDTDTICPRCKELWKEIVESIESKERAVNWPEVFDLLTSAHAEKG